MSEEFIWCQFSVDGKLELKRKMRLPARLWKLRFDWRSAIWQAAEGMTEYGDALCREVLQDFGGCVVDLGGGGVRV